MISDNKVYELSSQYLASCLEASSVWTEVLQGRGDMREALARFSALTCADSCGVARSKGFGEKPEQYGTFLRKSGGIARARDADCVSFGYFGSNLFQGLEATVWAKSDCSHNGSSNLRMTPLTNGSGVPLQDIRSIILEKCQDGMTVLELQFRSIPSSAAISAIDLISKPLSNSWKRRLPGIAIISSLQAVNSDGRNSENETLVPILSFQNPKGLSRAEFRICVMVNGGMQVKSIADALQISERTVRGHLSSIYSKIGVSGQFELLHLLTFEGVSEKNSLIAS